MNDIKKENETLKQIIDKLVEMIHDIIQPMYKQHYYNFIILKYDIFYNFKMHISIANDPKQKNIFNKTNEQTLDATIENEISIIKKEIEYSLKYCNIYIIFQNLSSRKSLIYQLNLLKHVKNIL